MTLSGPTFPHILFLWPMSASQSLLLVPQSSKSSFTSPTACNCIVNFSSQDLGTELDFKPSHLWQSSLNLILVLCVTLSPFLLQDLLTTSVPPEQLKVDYQDQNRNTALHLSCLQGHEDCALAILEKCGDNLINTTNADEKTYVSFDNSLASLGNLNSTWHELLICILYIISNKTKQNNNKNNNNKICIASWYLS